MSFQFKARSVPEKFEVQPVPARDEETQVKTIWNKVKQPPRSHLVFYLMGPVRKEGHTHKLVMGPWYSSSLASCFHRALLHPGPRGAQAWSKTSARGGRNVRPVARDPSVTGKMCKEV